jgi:hypothetical protein
MADKNSTAKLKKVSQSERKHIRRLKQEARKTTNAVSSTVNSTLKK